MTLNTDNLTVSGTDLRKEYNLVKKQFSLSDDTLKAIALNSADASFLTAEEKKNLKEYIDKEFVKWLYR